MPYPNPQKDKSTSQNLLGSTSSWFPHLGWVFLVYTTAAASLLACRTIDWDSGTWDREELGMLSRMRRLLVCAWIVECRCQCVIHLLKRRFEDLLEQTSTFRVTVGTRILRRHSIFLCRNVFATLRAQPPECCRTLPSIGTPLGEESYSGHESTCAPCSTSVPEFTS